MSDRDYGTSERLYVNTLKSIRMLAARVDEGVSCPWRAGMPESQRNLPEFMPRAVLESELRLLARLEEELGVYRGAHT
jgi:hypothetical protein